MEISKPKLYYVGSTLNSIFLRWEIEEEKSGLIYRIEMKDDTYLWITKYWGMKTHCEIKTLSPETLYYFRLGVSLEVGGEEVLSDVLVTATNVGPPILFYLFKSAERGDIEGLQNFLKERKDSAALDAFDKRGETALIKGVKKGSKDIVKMLLSAGANVNQGALGTSRTPLMYACYLGNEVISKFLIENGADINSIDINNCGPLHYAVDNSQLDLVKLCLELGSDINMRDAAGWTPLIRAVILNSDIEIVKELLSCNADVFAQDRNGRTALNLATLDKNNCHIDVLSKYEAELKIDSIKSAEMKEMCNLKENENTKEGESNVIIQLEDVVQTEIGTIEEEKCIIEEGI